MKLARISVLCAGGVIAPDLACANAGVPMIFLTLPGMLIALLPVVAVESVIVSRRLRLAFRQAAPATALGNVVSTVIGMPVTWVILVAGQVLTGGSMAYGLESPIQRLLAVTWQAPWLIPYEPELDWMIPAATLTLLIPFGCASWWIEYMVERRLLKQVEGRQLNHAIRDANLISYGMLALVVLGFLLTAKAG